MSPQKYELQPFLPDQYRCTIEALVAIVPVRLQLGKLWIVRVALLEDDRDQARLIQTWLEEEGHSCMLFNSGKEFIRNLKNESFDVLILDWLVPDMDGLEVLHWIRDGNQLRVPVLFVTVLTNEDDIVKALDAGADDYMGKPIKRRELLARLGAITRRSSPDFMLASNFEMPPYNIHYDTHCIHLNGKAIDLTQKEFDLAVFLFRHADRVLSRGHILENVWGANPKLNTRTVDTHISRIRKKLSLTEENGWELTSIYQHGYRLESLAHV